MCSRASVTASGTLLWLSKGRSLKSSAFFFTVADEGSGIKEGFRKYPQMSSPFSGTARPAESVVFNAMEKAGAIRVSKLKQYPHTYAYIDIYLTLPGYSESFIFFI